MTRRTERITLWIGIAVSAVLLAALSIWKYQTFQMNGLDLAYFNQVFWNTNHGRPFGLSIHPTLSLGDHAEFFILALAPLYALLPRPETLLVLQAVALALSGWPVYRITRRLLNLPPSPKRRGDENFRSHSCLSEPERASSVARKLLAPNLSPSREDEAGRADDAARAVLAQRGSEFAGKEAGRPGSSSWPLLLGLAVAFSPFLQNAALYEFHVLPFALPLLLFAADAYVARSLRRFLVLLILALTVREDVALVAAAFGLIAANDRRGWKWIALPIGISAAWFLGAIKLIGRFSVGGSYKFAAYYSWLLDGTTPQEIARHFLTLPTLEFFLGLMIPFIFLPLLRPQWLLLSALPAAQQLLTGQGAGALVFQMHYVVLLLPGLILATVEAIARRPPNLLPPFKRRGDENFRSHSCLSEPERASSVARKFPAPGLWPPILGPLFIITTIYSIATLGPLPAVARMMARGEPDPKLVAAKNAVIRSIPAEASVLASYDLLPAVSSREKLYSLHYAFPGKTQFSATDYIFPDPDEIILNEEDFLVFALNFPTLGWTSDYYTTGDDRLRALLGRGYGLTEVRGPLLRFRRGAPNSADLFSVQSVRFETAVSNRTQAMPGLDFLRGEPISCPAGNDLCLKLYLERDGYEPAAVEPFLHLALRGADGSAALDELLPLGFGIYPPSSWPNQKTVELTVPLILPDGARPASAEIRLVRPEGILALSGVRSGLPLLTSLVPLGPAISFPLEAGR